jgi:hypothetical protein
MKAEAIRSAVDLFVKCANRSNNKVDSLDKLSEALSEPDSAANIDQILGRFGLELQANRLYPGIANRICFIGARDPIVNCHLNFDGQTVSLGLPVTKRKKPKPVAGSGPVPGWVIEQSRRSPMAAFDAWQREQEANEPDA